MTARRPSWSDEANEWIRENPGSSWEQFRQAGFTAASPEAYARQQRRLRSTSRAAIDGGSVVLRQPPHDEDIEERFRLLEEASRIELSTSQDWTEYRPDDPGKPIAVAYTGDWHCGAKGTDLARLREDLDLIAATPGLVMIGMGDYHEGVSIHSKASPALYSGSFNDSGEQELYVKRALDRVKHKTLAVISGNHDEWLYRNAGLQRMSRIAADLGVPHFGEGGGTVEVVLDGASYLIGVRHNVAGNSRLNTTNAQRRMFDDWPLWESCHVLTIAHFHYNDLHVQSRRGGNPVTYLRSGTYKLADPYAKAGGFTPEWGVPVTILSPDRQCVVPFRGDQFHEALHYFRMLRG